MTHLKRVVIKEELVALTGDALSALLLNQILYWSERVQDFDAFIAEEKRRGGDPNIELTNGWIYKSAPELGEEIMMDVSTATIRRRLEELVEAGYLDKRESPAKWDRTYQYRPNIYTIQRDLAGLGYALDGYPLQFRFGDEEEGQPSAQVTEPGSCEADYGSPRGDGEREGSSVHGEGSNAHGEGSSAHGEGSSTHGEGSSTHSEGTVPEITSEITSEIRNRNNNTPASTPACAEREDVVVAARAGPDAAFAALQDLGMVPDSLARQYARADPDTALRWAEYARREGLGAAYVRKRLEAGDRPPPRRRRTVAPPQATKVYR